MVNFADKCQAIAVETYRCNYPFWLRYHMYVRLILQVDIPDPHEGSHRMPIYVTMTSPSVASRHPFARVSLDPFSCTTT